MRKLLLALLSLALSSSVGAQSCCDRAGPKSVGETSGTFWPGYPTAQTYNPDAVALANTLNVDEERASFCGYWVVDGTGTSITLDAADADSTFQWLPSTTTFANPSTHIFVGVQDIDASNGPPGRGDGTFDIYADLVGGTDTITANTWKVADFTNEAVADVTITEGTLGCIVFELDAVAGGDTHAPASVNTATGAMPVAASFDGTATWTFQATAAPNALVTGTDGTRAWLAGTYPMSSSTTDATFNDTSNPDEYGRMFTMPFDAEIQGVELAVQVDSGSSDFTISVYSDPTGTPVSLGSISVDSNNLAATGTAPRTGTFYFSTKPIVKKGQRIIAAVRALGANSSNDTTISVVSVNNNADLAALPGGINSYTGTRQNGSGAFTAVTTSSPAINLLLKRIQTDN